MRSVIISIYLISYIQAAEGQSSSLSSAKSGSRLDDLTSNPVVIPLLIVAAAVVTGIFCILTNACGLRKKSRHRPRAPKTQSVDNLNPVSAVSALEIQLENTKQSSANSNGTSSVVDASESTMEGTVDTLVSSNQGRNLLAVPVFLRLQYGTDVRPGKRLKAGGGGSVFKAEILATAIQTPPDGVVVKLFKEKKNEQAVQAIYQEISMTYMLARHRNFVQFVAFCDQPFAMILKFYRLGSLTHLLKSSPKVFTKTNLISFLNDISSGLSHMASRGFAHCDMKPDNVLVDKMGGGKLLCVLTDFGIAQIVSQQSLGVQGFQVANLNGASIIYASPESFARARMRVFHPASVIIQTDVYSFGASLYHLICRRRPWAQCASKPKSK